MQSVLPAAVPFLIVAIALSVLVIGPWLRRRKVRKQLRAMGNQSFTVDVCEPGSMLADDGTRFGTMTFRNGTTIRGTV